MIKMTCIALKLVKFYKYRFLFALYETAGGVLVVVGVRDWQIDVKRCEQEPGCSSL
jgi:hypothetical protein